jgi:hypothetical protein
VGVESISVIREDPMAAIGATIGTGPSIPVVDNITTPGSVDISTLAIPPGRDVTVELWSGGGGGATGDNASDGGGGGGGGAYACVTVPADLWALGGTLVIAASAAGATAPPANGTAGHFSKLTIDAIDRITCTGGAGGVAVAGTGGAGGVASIGAGVAAVQLRNGTAGHAKSTTTGGAGGQGAGPGGGAGGAGGAPGDGLGGNGVLSGGGGGGGGGDTGHGGLGQAGRALISY